MDINLSGEHLGVSIGHATEGDLPALSRIATRNFQSARNYERLDRTVVAGFAECNSVDNLRKKLHSGRHVLVVARNRAGGEAIAFGIYKKLNPTCMLATRMHASPEFSGLSLARKIHWSMVARMREEGYHLLYADLSGKGQAAMSRAVGFLYVDSFANTIIQNTHIDRVVTDVQASHGTARAESVLLPLLAEPGGSPYARFLDGYGLVAERLLRKVERMHENADSGISQPVLSHVTNGLVLVQDLRERLGRHLLGYVSWPDVETMWIFHDIGEIGMGSDIPSYKKTKLDSANEEAKAQRILGSIEPRDLRATLLDLHGRYERRKVAAPTAGHVDREAVICAFVDKLEASTFIGTSGIGDVWKRRAGRWIFQRILKRHALGAFLRPARELCGFLDAAGREHVERMLVHVVHMYHDRALISSRFRDQRLAAVRDAVR